MSHVLNRTTEPQFTWFTLTEYLIQILQNSPGSDPHPRREEEEEEEAVESRLFTQRLHIISVCSTEPGS